MNTIESLITPLNIEEETELKKLLSHPLIVKHIRNIMHVAVIELLSIPYDQAATLEGKANKDLTFAYNKGIIENCNTLLEQTT